MQGQGPRPHRGAHGGLQQEGRGRQVAHPRRPIAARIAGHCPFLSCPLGLQPAAVYAPIQFMTDCDG
ncbi:Aminomethyltransferase [Zea mays]|uniref:Aminomethyltransferase n=1 Tax=Zea mays TaxID=4577 RepID=A0A1D6DYS8_MAIZE|nr:Aminomethyltransferase [Zea mays]